MQGAAGVFNAPLPRHPDVAALERGVSYYLLEKQLPNGDWLSTCSSPNRAPCPSWPVGGVSPGGLGLAGITRVGSSSVMVAGPNGLGWCTWLCWC